MSPRLDLSRRRALLAAAGAGVSLTFLGGVARAGLDPLVARRKLVVIICRGAMDGLSVSPPVGEADYAGLRREIAIPGFGQPGGALALDTTFGLHPKLTTVHALALKGQARIAPAIATPDRARSHFEAQDVLESGSAQVYGQASGWLNRALVAISPDRRIEALSVGAQAPLILRGPFATASWSPGGYRDRDSRLPGILADLYAHDPLLGPALASGLSTEAEARLASAAVKADPMTAAMDPADAPMPAPKAMIESPAAAAGAPMTATQAQGAYARNGAKAARTLGATLAKLMAAPGGPQVAALSIDGFDTHANQGASEGQLANRLAYLDATIEGLTDGLGPAWGDTVVVVATEFGRTARINGTKGTDHGTGSTALVLGGGLARGGLIGDWPGLQQARLFENRDTAPSLDMRALFKGVLAEQLGVDRRALDTTVFPDSAAVAPVRGLVA